MIVLKNLTEGLTYSSLCIILIGNLELGQILFIASYKLRINLLLFLGHLDPEVDLKPDTEIIGQFCVFAVNFS